MIGPARRGGIRRDTEVLEKPAKLRGDLLCLAEIGGDPERVVAGSDATLADIMTLKLLPQTVIAALFDRLAETAPDGFALRAGELIRLRYLGLLGQRLSNCRTIGELLSDWERYSLIISYPLRSSLVVRADRWTMTFVPRYHLTARALDFCVTSTLAGFVPSLENLTGHRLELHEAGFPFAGPRDRRRYAGVARQVLFGQASARVVGDARDLGLAIPTADPEALALCETYCSDSLARLAARRPTTDQVREALKAHGPGGPDIGEVSGWLNVSTRSLQRALAAEGATFQSLLEAHRRACAMELLSRGGEPKTIAFTLAFRDVSSFSRAFKRWTGEPPGAWARQRRP